MLFEHTEQQVSAILNPFKDGNTVPIKNDVKILGWDQETLGGRILSSKGDRNPTAIPVGSEILWDRAVSGL